MNEWLQSKPAASYLAISMVLLHSGSYFVRLLDFTTVQKHFGWNSFDGLVRHHFHIFKLGLHRLLDNRYFTAYLPLTLKRLLITYWKDLRELKPIQ